MTRVRWAAWADGTAHAVPALGRAVRTACGLPALSEALEWPASRRCASCLSVHPQKEAKARRRKPAQTTTPATSAGDRT